MKYIKLGRVDVSIIGLGTWQIGTRSWGWGTELGPSNVAGILDAARDVGINLIDTAPNYGIHLVTCTSNKKDIVKFFFNNDPTAAGIKDNKVIKIKGFIKSHVESDYNGLKETVINRVKMEN